MSRMRDNLSVDAVRAPEIQKVGTGPLGLFLEAGTLKYIKKMRLSPRPSFSHGDLDRSSDQIVAARPDDPRADELALAVNAGIAVG
jgi:hypothetical protein